MARTSTIKLDKFGRQCKSLLHLGAERMKYFCDEKTCEKQKFNVAKILQNALMYRPQRVVIGNSISWYPDRG